MQFPGFPALTTTAQGIVSCLWTIVNWVTGTVRERTLDNTWTDKSVSLTYPTILRVDTTAVAPITITLTTTACANLTYMCIKDSGFNAFANNITITTEGGEQIEGVAPPLIIAVNGGVQWLAATGTAWVLL